MADGFIELAPEILNTQAGIAELNRMLRELYNAQAGDGQDVRIFNGYGTPEGNVAAKVGALYLRQDGDVATTLYVKESGSGDSGWAGVLTTDAGIVDRGDASAADYAIGDLTANNSWHDLSFSSVAPAGAKILKLFVELSDETVANSQIKFRKNGNTNEKNIEAVQLQEANIIRFGSIWVFCDSNRTIEYKIPTTTITTLNITNVGWKY